MANGFYDPILAAILGATNTGKTHYAVERMLARQNGIIGLPLRLLAREVYDKICKRIGAHQVALVTGEEKIIPRKARFYVCTVEAMPYVSKGESKFAFVAIDEIQLMNHPERGHIFTERLLHARGTEETLFLGAETAGPLIKLLLPKCRIERRERYSTLTYSGAAKITKLPKRSVIVAFSAKDVYAIAELIRRYRGGAAVVMGGLSPRTRNAQAELFQSGEVDFLVATDAVGMGLNLDTEHVAFAQIKKFDGRRRRMLTPMEIGQIAGRAGRFKTDGTFGPTGDCLAFDDETIERVENHNYEAFYQAEWRNTDLRFESLESLKETLYQKRPHRNLRRIRGSVDEASFERMIAIPEVVKGINIPVDVKRLWQVCQIPDFRNMTIDAHVRLLQDIYRLILRNGGKIPDDYMDKQIKRLDITEGDVKAGVDQLSSRLAQIRTWTYCANKIEWMRDAREWVERTREVEDKLSDALHDSLTARFVDRKTNALLKTIGAAKDMDAKILDDGQVTVDDHVIGSLEGLAFKLADSTTELEAKTMQAAAEKVVAPEVDRRLTSLCGGTHAIFTMSPEGHIMWGGQAVGRISNGGSVFNPDAELIGGELGQPTLQNMAQQRMRDFLRAEVTEKLAPLTALKELSENNEIPGETRGVAFELYENFGNLERRQHAAKIKALTQEMRGPLRTAGVVFGQYHIYLRDMMKPKPATLLCLLNSHGAGGDKKPFIPFAGMTSLKNEGELQSDNYAPEAITIAGYAALGPRIIRLDILDRLSKQIRQAQERGPRNSFQIMQEMLALLGASYEEVRGVLSAMGFKSQEGEIDPAELKKLEARAAEREQVALAKEAAKSGEAVEAKTETVTETKPAETSKKSRHKELNVHHERVIHPDGRTEDTPNVEYWFMPSRRNNNPRPQSASDEGEAYSSGRSTGKPRAAKQNIKEWGGKGGGNKNRGKGKGGARKPQDYQSKPSKPRNIEDSPFAALAALKGLSGKKE